MGPKQEAISYLEAKLDMLEDKFGHFLRYEKSLAQLKERLVKFAREKISIDG